MNRKQALTPSQARVLMGLTSFLQGHDHAMLIHGPAGTGKTFLLREICRDLRTKNYQVKLLAPTGRASRILQQSTGLPSSTLHREIYQPVREDKNMSMTSDPEELFHEVFEIRPNRDPKNTVYMIDEGSMVSEANPEDDICRFGSGNLLQDFIKFVFDGDQSRMRKIIFAGDSFQLPPVGSLRSPALSRASLERKYGLGCREYTLQEIVRQRLDSGILRHAHFLRNGIAKGDYSRLELKEDLPEIQHLDSDNLSVGGNRDEIVIAFSNARVQSLNRRIRESLNGNPATPLRGEPVVACRNLYSGADPLMNGEFATLLDVSDEVISRAVPLNKPENGMRKIITVPLRFRKVRLGWPGPDGQWVERDMMMNETFLWSAAPRPEPDERKALYVDFCRRHPDRKPGTAQFQEKLKDDPWFQAAWLKFGYAVTCHKAQGGEWRRVVVDFEGRRQLNEDAFRWIYTALTRAKEEIHLIRPPRVTAMTPMQTVARGVVTEVKRASATPPLPSLASRISEQLPPGVHLSALTPQPYAWAVKLHTLGGEPMEFQARLCFNRRGVFTSIDLQPPSGNPVAIDVEKALQKLQGQPVSLPPPDREIKGNPNEAQRLFLHELNERLQETAFVFCRCVIHTPYHLQVHIRFGAEEQRFDVWHRGTGRLKGMAVSGSQCAWALDVLQQVLDPPKVSA